MRNYDYKQVRELIKKHADELLEATLGMHEDWFWTASTVWKNGKYTQRLTKNTKIGGIAGSGWATPTLCLSFKDERPDEMIPVFTGVKSTEQKFPVDGCLSGPMQEKIPPLFPTT